MEEEWNLPTELPDASRRLVERLVEAGWHRIDDDMISHPTRPELHVVLNPPFEFSLSPRLVEFLMEHKKPWAKIFLDALSK
jgi:hypothetical protein